MTEQLRVLLKRAETMCPEDAPRTLLCITEALALLNQPAAGDPSEVIELLRDAMGKVCSSGNVRLQELQRRDVRLLAEAAQAALPTPHPQEWLPLETRPTDEESPFLVRVPGNDVCKELAIQVTNFEGRMYPDVMDGLIDWEDAVTNAIGWMPLPATTTQTKK